MIKNDVAEQMAMEIDNLRDELKKLHAELLAEKEYSEELRRALDRTSDWSGPMFKGPHD